jgi:branched-chain amino acid transport system permease protein
MELLQAVPLDQILIQTVNGIVTGMILALIASGLTLIFGIMDVVNFAHGELLMLAMYATFVLWFATGLDPLLLLIPVALALFALGVAIYHLLMARALSVRFNRGMVQIFVTFGLAIFLRGAAQFAFGSDFKSVSTSLLANHTIDLRGVFVPMPQLAAGIVSLLAFGCLFAIGRTEFGRALEATREDREAVALIGIDRDRIFALGWGLGAAAVGVAGAMLATFYYVSPNVGANFALIAYVTVALGGFGSLFGALVAGLLIGEVEALTALLIEPSLKQVGMFVIYLAVLMFRPRGLFGTL